uniref:LRRK2 ARM repeat domain-containing protein n=1 Tax=Pinguiococcus pyrenoidosus TaxID=172671 RepID=A0A7R9YC81_9STRA
MEAEALVSRALARTDELRDTAQMLIGHTTLQISGADKAVSARLLLREIQKHRRLLRGLDRDPEPLDALLRALDAAVVAAEQVGDGRGCLCSPGRSTRRATRRFQGSLGELGRRLEELRWSLEALEKQESDAAEDALPDESLPPMLRASYVHALPFSARREATEILRVSAGDAEDFARQLVAYSCSVKADATNAENEALMEVAIWGLRRYFFEKRVATSTLLVLTRNIRQHPSRELREKFVGEGLFDGVRDTLRHHEHAPGVLLQATNLLCKMIRGRNAAHFRDQLMNLGIADLVLTAMAKHQSHAGLQTNACEIVSGLSRGSEARKEELMKLGVADALVAAMSTHSGNAQLQEHACAAISNLACGDNARRQVFVSLDAQRYIGDALRLHKSKGQVQSNGCAAIGMLFITQGMGEEVAVETAFPELVVSALRNFKKDPGVQEHGCGAIWILALDHSELQTELIEIGAIRVLAKALLRYGGKAAITMNALGALASLAHKVDEHSNGRSLAVEGSRLIVDAIRLCQEDTAVLEQALKAIQNLTSGSGEWKDALLARDAVAAVLTVMEKHMECASLQEQALATVWVIAASVDNQGRKNAYDVYAGIASAVVTSMEHHADNACVQENGCGAICHLAARGFDLKALLIAKGAADLINASVERFPDNLALRHRAQKAIQELEKRSRDPLTNGALQALTRVSLHAATHVPVDVGLTQV